MSNTSPAVKFLSESWNRIAAAIGVSITAQGVKLESIRERFRLPRWGELFWPASWWRYLAEMYRVAHDWVSTAIASVSEVVDAARDILIQINAGKWPFPKELRSKVMRGDDAMRFVLGTMLDIALDITGSDAQEIAEQVTDYTAPTISVDPDAEPSRAEVELALAKLKVKQALWKSFISTIVAFSLIWLPLTMAYAVGVTYWKSWTEPNKLPTLAQDSKRQTFTVKADRRRVNEKVGPDRS